MKHQNTAAGNINAKPIIDPLARIRDEGATLPSAFVVIQGGCVRAWLIGNLGFLLVGIGWLFACTPMALPGSIEYTTAFIIASWFFGLGVGWLICCEGGGR